MALHRIKNFLSHFNLPSLMVTMIWWFSFGIESRTTSVNLSVCDRNIKLLHWFANFWLTIVFFPGFLQWKKVCFKAKHKEVMKFLCKRLCLLNVNGLARITWNVFYQALQDTFLVTFYTYSFFFFWYHVFILQNTVHQKSLSGLLF